MPTTFALRTSSAPHSAPHARPAPSLNAALLGLVEMLEMWGARRSQRRALRSLPDYLVSDIGRSRTDVEAEAAKPFWRA